MSIDILINVNEDAGAVKSHVTQLYTIMMQLIYERKLNLRG